MRKFVVLLAASMAIFVLSSCASKSNTCTVGFVQVPPVKAIPKVVEVVVTEAPVAEVILNEIVIYFDFNKAIIRPSEQPKIDEAAKILKNHPTAVARLEGNTDPIGTDGSNMALGYLRANTAKAALVDRGVDPKRLSTVSYGETRLVKPGLKGKAENEVNRRTVVVIKIK